MKILSDYYTLEQFEFPSKEDWQFGNAVNRTIDGIEVKIFFSKDDIDINGGTYELTTEEGYPYYEFFENGEEIMATIQQYGIDYLPHIIFVFVKGVVQEDSELKVEEKYIVYGVKVV